MPVLLPPRSPGNQGPVSNLLMQPPPRTLHMARNSNALDLVSDFDLHHREAVGKDGFFFDQTPTDSVGSLEDDHADSVDLGAFLATTDEVDPFDLWNDGFEIEDL